MEKKLETYLDVDGVDSGAGQYKNHENEINTSLEDVVLEDEVGSDGSKEGDDYIPGENEVMM